MAPSSAERWFRTKRPRRQSCWTKARWIRCVCEPKDKSNKRLRNASKQQQDRSEKQPEISCLYSDGSRQSGSACSQSPSPSDSEWETSDHINLSALVAFRDGSVGVGMSDCDSQFLFSDFGFPCVFACRETPIEEGVFKARGGKSGLKNCNVPWSQHSVLLACDSMSLLVGKKPCVERGLQRVAISNRQTKLNKVWQSIFVIW